MERLFAAVLSMSATGCLVIAVVLAARLLLKRAPKIFSYALWSVVLVRLVCPVSFSSPHYGVPRQGDPPMAYFSGQGTAMHAVSPEIVQTQQQAGAAAGVSPLFVLSIVWAAGAAGMLLYGIFSYGRLRRKLVGAVHLQDNIYMADYLDTPFVMGIVRPKIYLPSTMEDWEKPYILAHEQHHIRRLDYLIKPVAFLTLCLHWFNPLVWVSFLLFCKDMEMSCDEAVLKKLGAEVRADYSAALLSLASGRKIIAGMPLAFGEGDTRGRIKNMKHWKRPAAWIAVAAALCCVLVAAILLTDKKEQTSGQSGQQMIDALVNSIHYGEQNILFTVPAGAKNAEDWTILIYGRTEYPDGMTMSQHYLEGTVWEAGKEYSIDLEGTESALQELNLYASCLEAERDVDLTVYLPGDDVLPLTEENANACMAAILNSFAVNEDGTVHFQIPHSIPQSDNEAVCLSIDLNAEFSQGERDASQIMLENARSWKGGDVYTGKLDLSIGELERIFMRVSFPEVQERGWKDVFPGQYLELTPPFENHITDSEQGDTISAVQNGRQILVDLVFSAAPAVQLSFTLPEGVVLGQAINEPDRSGYLLNDQSGNGIGEFFFMGLAAEEEDLKNIKTDQPQLPMQIFAGAALPNHVMYEEYQVQAFTKTGAAATALFSSQNLDLMGTGEYDAAAEIPFENRKNLALYYDYEKMPVFLQIGFDEAAVSRPECAEIAESIVVG